MPEIYRRSRFAMTNVHAEMTNDQALAIRIGHFGLVIGH